MSVVEAVHITISFVYIKQFSHLLLCICICICYRESYSLLFSLCIITSTVYFYCSNICVVFILILFSYVYWFCCIILHLILNNYTLVISLFLMCFLYFNFHVYYMRINIFNTSGACLFHIQNIFIIPLDLFCL